MPDTPARPELPPAWMLWRKIPLYSTDNMQRYGGEIEAWARADERRKALEEAAKACTSTMLMNIDSYCGATAHACADRIRALIDKEPTT